MISDESSESKATCYLIVRLNYLYRKQQLEPLPTHDRVALQLLSLLARMSLLESQSFVNNEVWSGAPRRTPSPRRRRCHRSGG